MKKSLHAAAGLLLFCIALASCSSQPALPPLANDAAILAFGDSLTAGNGAASGEDYPTVLESMTGRRVINAGISGEVTSDGLRRLPEILDRETPGLLILCHGGNDMLQHAPFEQTEANLRAMIQTARDRGISVVLVAVPAPRLPLAPPALYANLAKEFSLPIEEDILVEILKKGDLKADQVHPNAAGYRRLAESMAVLLKESGAIK
ncbi:arylesterase [Desulfomicrobium orale]|uniref:Arylesterase n=1 Tax=Desulfomicrobium orale DSM 12838 TaxID=888061 RepID=A0A0X8JQE0_9BACT|nr:arylesterase [Desulfomicrobium orale]AMD93059.1 arylesterase [Desulfomicrobium orale DSM 12838]